MLDAAIRRVIDPALNAGGRALAARGARADVVTLAGLVAGLLAALLIALGVPTLWALPPLLAGRLADGLDGAVARAAGQGATAKGSDFGAFLDICADFAFYAAIPLAFAFRAPENALPAAVLLAAFYVNGTTFLAFAAIAARRGLETSAQGVKLIYYSTGLLEGTETVIFFMALCLWPQHFAPLAWGFGLACLASALLRAALSARLFRG